VVLGALVSSWHFFSVTQSSRTGNRKSLYSGLRLHDRGTSVPLVLSRPRWPCHSFIHSQSAVMPLGQRRPRQGRNVNGGVSGEVAPGY